MWSSVLITGGTGYFGHHAVKRLIDMEIPRICIYSRDEAKQAAMKRKFDYPGMRFFIGDCRDVDRLRRAMHDVELVLHAAALKRIDVGFYDPSEVVKTNVLGSQNVVDAALDTGSKAILLSSDKAESPVSAYGYSKALAESLFLAGGDQFSVCRYGNVSGSTGSVIPVWRSMGDVVPVTDPDCTRFWMYPSEAVDLVLDTAKTMPREIAIPELPAYRLGDLAEAMGKKMEIRGLPDFEKKHESMIAGETSEMARRMSVDEIREALSHG
jgi:FlaA1/EpsC-like NDP-sugar epimerase